jgi:hypothetical protein
MAAGELQLRIATGRRRALSSKVVELQPLAQKRRVTVREAMEESARIGCRVFWRPDGYISRTQPELDLAEILEG